MLYAAPVPTWRNFQPQFPGVGSHYASNDNILSKQMSKMAADALSAQGLHVIETLGEGSQAIVFLCRTNEESTAAVKVFHKDLPDDLSQNMELMALKALKGVPNVIQTKKVFHSLGYDCVVMEPAQTDLRNLLDEQPHLSHSEQHELSREVLRALWGIHANGWRHNDVKLENVLMMPDGRIVLSDLGLACCVEDLPKMYARAGTYALLPPEDLKKRFGVPGKSAAADAYAAGCLIFELIYPAARESDNLLPLLQKVKYDLQSPFRKVVCGLMNADPERRMPLEVALKLL